MNTELLKIGELASEANISTDTLRYYEQQKLIKPAMRNSAGYRLYSREELKRIGFILSAKEVGFTLSEIQQLLSLEVTKDEQSCADVKFIVDHKIVEVDQRLKKLRRIKRSLQTLSGACCGGAEPATHCTILETLSDTSIGLSSDKLNDQASEKNS